MAQPLRQSYLTFQSFAFQFNRQHSHNHRQFRVLCGDNPPTIIDGYGKWAVIDRPLRQGLTVPQGFNPAKLKVEIRFGIWDGRFGFDGWDTSSTASGEVEKNIDDLHWMAGGNALSGPSPLVYMDSYNLRKGTAVRNDLVPKQYRGVPWIISDGIEWGPSLRHREGGRIYQDATFNVMGFSSEKSANPSIPEQTRLAGGYFQTNGTYRTTYSIAAAHSSRTPEVMLEYLARKICKQDRNNPVRGTTLHLSRRSIYWQMPLGIDVWVPSHQI
jgi:hypothetical protein